MNKYEYAVDPRKLKEGDRVVYRYDNRWTVVKKIDFYCEGEGCGIRHLGYVMRHRSEHQLWSVDNESSGFWSHVCLLKDWPKKKKIYKKKLEQESEQRHNRIHKNTN